MKALKPSEALKAAKNLILDPANWHQGAWYGESDNQMCAGMAITQAQIAEGISGVEVLADKMWHYVHEALPAGQSILQFNDKKGRVHGEVMALFDEAIAKAEAAGE